MKDTPLTGNDQPNKSFIKLSRKVRQHWLWKASRKKTKFEAWIDLLFRANFEAGKEPYGHDLIDLKRGELLCSQEGLAKDWGWDRSAVRHFLKQLESDQMVIMKVTNKFTVITLCNYATYNDKQPAQQQQDNNNPTSKQHQDNTYKNDKNKKNGKNIDVAPFSEDSLNELWQKWIEFRKQKKDPLTEIGANEQIKMLSQYPSDIIEKIISKSIQKGWKGLFDDDYKSSSNVRQMPLVNKAIGLDDDEMIVYESGLHLRPSPIDLDNLKTGKITISFFDRKAS
jgi:DNA replication protein DnaD